MIPINERYNIDGKITKKMLTRGTRFLTGREIDKKQNS